MSGDVRTRSGQVITSGDIRRCYRWSGPRRTINGCALGANWRWTRASDKGMHRIFRHPEGGWRRAKWTSPLNRELPGTPKPQECPTECTEGPGRRRGIDGEGADAGVARVCERRHERPAPVRGDGQRVDREQEVAPSGGPARERWSDRGSKGEESPPSRTRGRTCARVRACVRKTGGRGCVAKKGARVRTGAGTRGRKRMGGGGRAPVAPVRGRGRERPAEGCRTARRGTVRRWRGRPPRAADAERPASRRLRRTRAHGCSSQAAHTVTCVTRNPRGIPWPWPWR